MSEISEVKEAAEQEESDDEEVMANFLSNLSAC
jgi:hypothetical protein